MFPHLFPDGMDYIFILIQNKEPTCSLYGLSRLKSGLPRYSHSIINALGFTDTVGARTALLPPNAILPEWEDVLTCFLFSTISSGIDYTLSKILDSACYSGLICPVTGPPLSICFCRLVVTGTSFE